MIYQFDDQIKNLSAIQIPIHGCCVGLFANIDEADLKDFLLSSLSSNYPSHLEVQSEGYFGVIQKSKYNNLGIAFDSIQLYLHHHILLLVIKDDELREQINKSILSIHPPYTLEKLICAILELVRLGDKEIIQDCLNQLNDLDERVLRNETKDFLECVSTHHQLLRKLNDDMVGKIDLCEALLEDINDIFLETERYHLRSILKRYERVAGDILQGKEYIMQIRESYQNQVDIQLNQIMYLFTTVTIICLPLTLIAGWYGMNVKMPEFGWEHGYLFVTILAIVAMSICTYILLRKKLLHRK